MRTARVDAPGGHYPIFIGEGALEKIPAWLRRNARPSALHLVTDTTVNSRHGGAIRGALESVGVPVLLTVVPAGERSKSTRQLERIWRDAIVGGMDRRGCIIAFGGGVVGDLAGMAAATVLRGISFVQIPTTLLAMVDSSVGGKTGINIPEGKNLVGAFHQPLAVFADIAFLRTLPRRQVRAGWAEIIKTAAIRDRRLFGRLERDVARLGGVSPPAGELASVIHSACRIKAAVVSEDEREAGLRMILNFGHTLAHGLEAAVGYRGLLHGEAVAIGMVFASRLGLALGLVSEETVRRLSALVKAFGLPVRLPQKYAVRPPRVLRAMERDKKKGPRGQRWVLVPRVGTTRIVDDIPRHTVRTALEGFLDGRSTR